MSEFQVIYQEYKDLTDHTDGEQSVTVRAFAGFHDAGKVAGIELRVCSDNKSKNLGVRLVSCAGMTHAEITRKAIALFDQAVAEMNDPNLRPKPDTSFLDAHKLTLRSLADTLKYLSPILQSLPEKQRRDIGGLSHYDREVEHALALVKSNTIEEFQEQIQAIREASGVTPFEEVPEI